jgi:hypothetical protein
MVEWLITFFLVLCGSVFAGLVIAMLVLIVALVFRKTLGSGGSGASEQNRKLFATIRLFSKWSRMCWLAGFSLAIATVILGMIVGLWKVHLH